MAKKKNRAAAAARGTAADPRAEAQRIRSEAQDMMRDSRRLVGVMPERMADEVKASGTYPFTFKSAFILAGAGLLGFVVIPFLLDGQGVSIALSTTLSAPILLAAALAYTRYYVDSDRLFCRGLVITFVVTLVATALICWLLFYQGILI